MATYAYNCDVYCDDCSEAIIEDLPVGTEDTGDSNEFPQRIPDSDEVDIPEHCNDCGDYLAQPLTVEGIAYVVADLRHKSRNSILDTWAEHLKGLAALDDDDQAVLDAYLARGYFGPNRERTREDVADNVPDSGRNSVDPGPDPA